jgi:hypothetical protein
MMSNSNCEKPKTMSDNLQDLYESLRSESSVTDEGFKAIIAKLLSMGVVMREESTNEARLYDDARQIEPLLHSFFGIAGFRLTHNTQHNYFRLYPPGTVQDGEEGDAARRLRHRLTKDFSAYVLALRHLYQIAIETGDLNELGERVISIDDVGSAMAQLLRAVIPAQKSVRLEIYRELRIQKLVRLPKNFEDESADMMLSIRPSILDFVTEGQLRVIEAQARERIALATAEAELTLTDSVTKPPGDSIAPELKVSDAEDNGATALAPVDTAPTAANDGSEAQTPQEAVRGQVPLFFDEAPPAQKPLRIRKTRVYVEPVKPRAKALGRVARPRVKATPRGRGKVGSSSAARHR